MTRGAGSSTARSSDVDALVIDASKAAAPLRTSYLQYTLNSKHQADETVVRVLLPDGIPPEEITRVAFVLPASPQVSYRWGDGLDTFLRHDLHNRYTMAAVSPYFADWPWMADHPTDPRIQQVKYFLEDVLPIADALLPRAVRLLVGLSKSGSAAFQLLMRFPHLFEAISVFDAPLMKLAPDQWEMRDYWVTDDHYRDYAIPRLLEAHAERLRDRPRIALFGHGIFGPDHPEWSMNHIELAHQLMEQLGIPHFYDNNAYYEHRWDSGWMEKAIAALDELSRAHRSSIVVPTR